VWFYDGMEVFGQSFIPLLRKISGSSSQGIRFGSRFPRLVDDFEVELGEKLHPSRLPAVEQFGRHEIFQVLVIRKTDIGFSTDCNSACHSSNARTIAISSLS